MMIDTLQISNFKSIKFFSQDCARVNLFVGEPNAGKSNILEALDLSYLSWMMGLNDDKKEMNQPQIDIKKYFRVNKVENLFYGGDISEPIEIKHPGFSYGTSLEYIPEVNNDKFRLQSSASFTDIDNDFVPVQSEQFFSSPIIPYRYNSEVVFQTEGILNRLLPPFGENLGSLIKHHKSMQDLIKEFAEHNNFELKIHSNTLDMAILLRVNEGLVYELPYAALADTYKRMLFYIAAVRHPNGSVITLDEPDTHAFPKYVSYLADEIILQKSKQFFISTHNPYLLNQLIEKMPGGELAVFVCSYDKNKKSTVAKKISDTDLGELLDYGVDIFFNLNKYINDSIEYTA
jgi:AAA15 family ATPase/GTPase